MILTMLAAGLLPRKAGAGMAKTARQSLVSGFGLMGILIASAGPVEGFAAGLQADEFLACRAWFDQVFASTNQRPQRPSLKLLYEDVSDGVTRGRSWRGTPFQLRDKTYTHGLAFNSTKHILVDLGKPARHFAAAVGLENNDDTRRGEALGHGSVTFHVLVEGQEVFTTPVLRRKDGAKPLELDLHGASQFEIRVKDGGDGRGWDQALWAEAVIDLEDGTRLRLQDLPWDADAETNPSGLSFRYRETNSAALLAHWPRTVREEPVDAQRSRREITYRDSDTGLEARVHAVQFTDFPAVEWVAYLTNGGRSDTPILQNIQILDGPLPVPTSGSATLHWNKGAVASFDDFAPEEKALTPGTKFHLQPGGGRSSSQVMPFFNVEGAGAGIVAALGWSGEWAADFSADARAQPSMRAGMARTHLTLHPGESIRTPRLCLLFYQGDRWRGQNLWRQFVLAHHRPKPGGKPLVAPITCGNWGGTRADIHLDNIQKIIQQQLPIDYYWIDAEWFGQGGWPVNVGNWEVKKDLYPAGFKPLSQALRASGRELMLWFEPERVYKGTPWHKAHPEWLLDTGGDSLLFNLGNPAARKFLTDFISARIDEFGLGCYRQDFNIDPLKFWQAADAPDRQGMTEIRHIEGLYAFWDDLLKLHPDLIIDNCASGGRRIDLETLGRATPFWRTDGPRDPIAHQCHTYGLLLWVPLSATSQDRSGDDYEFRSSMCSSLCLNWWVAGDVPAERIPPDFPFGWAKNTLAQYLRLRDSYYGDFYPLTGYSQSADVWLAYQLAQPDGNRGLVVALRRPQSPYESARLSLRGLEPAASYRLTNLDTRTQSTHRGQELMQAGLELELKTKPGSALVVYQRE
jgi:alpha-galactosidase